MELQKIFENIESEVLTEEVKEKISVLIEAKINDAVSAKVEELEEHFEDYKEQEITKLEEKAVAYMDEHILDQIDSYFDYVAETYVEENKLAIDNGIKAQMYEKMVKSAKDFLAQNQITEAKIEESDDLLKENEELKEEAKRAINEVIELKKQIKGKEAVAVFQKVSEGLTETEVEKLKELAEDYDIDDIDSFRKKLVTLKESISSFVGGEDESESDESENIQEESDNDFDTDVIVEERKFSSAWDGVESEYL